VHTRLGACAVNLPSGVAGTAATVGAHPALPIDALPGRSPDSRADPGRRDLHRACPDRERTAFP